MRTGMVEIWKDRVLASGAVRLLRRRWWGELRCRSDELASASEFVGALGAAIGEQAIVPDSVEALGQDVQEEPANEIAGLERHGCVALGALDTIVLVFDVFERHAAFIGRE